MPSGSTLSATGYPAPSRIHPETSGYSPKGKETSMSILGSRPPHDRTIAPNLILRNVDVAIDFYQRALGAEVLYRGAMPNGETLHAQLRIGQGYFLLSNEIMCDGRMPTG